MSGFLFLTEKEKEQTLTGTLIGGVDGVNIFSFLPLFMARFGKIFFYRHGGFGGLCPPSSQKTVFL